MSNKEKSYLKREVGEKERDPFKKADEIFNGLREQITHIELISQALYEKMSRIEAELFEQGDNKSNN